MSIKDLDNISVSEFETRLAKNNERFRLELAVVQERVKKLEFRVQRKLKLNERLTKEISEIE